MQLATPHHLGGDYYVTAVSVGRDPDADTVRDCPTCGGYVADDEWTVAATVVDRADDSRAEHVHCGTACLREWLRLCVRGVA